MKFFSTFFLVMSLLIITAYAAEEITTKIDIATLQEQLDKEAQQNTEFEKLQQHLAALRETNQAMKESNTTTAKQVLAYDNRSFARNTKKMNRINRQLAELKEKDTDTATKQIIKQKLDDQKAALQKRNEEIFTFKEQYKKYTKKC